MEKMDCARRAVGALASIGAHLVLTFRGGLELITDGNNAAEDELTAMPFFS
jgi:hypothetical protein